MIRKVLKGSRKALSWLCAVSLFATVFTVLLALPAAAQDTVVDNGIPILSITLNDNFIVGNLDKDTYRGATYSLTGGGYADIINAKTEIKGRGNSTWTMEKKPYALKLDKKTDLMGMGKSKKWVLLANHIDKTLLRNYATLNLARDMGLSGTPECRYVDVYMNGDYYGNYLLTEKVEIDEERVNIGNDGGVLFEIENKDRHNSDCDRSAETHIYCHTTPGGVHINFKEPEDGDMTSEAFSTMLSSNKTFLDTMENSLTGGYAEYSKYIDVDSFIDWYILSEFCKNYDSTFVTSVYCYRTSTGKLFMGPAWDYDTPYGNQDANGYGQPEGFMISGAPWYAKLFGDNTFIQAVKDRYKQLRENGTFDKFFANISTGRAQISASKDQNFTRWPNVLPSNGWRGDNSGKIYYTYWEEINYFRDFAAKRLQWLDDQLNPGATSQGSLRAKFSTMIGGFPDAVISQTNPSPAQVSEAKALFAQLNEESIRKIPEIIQKEFRAAKQKVGESTAIASFSPVAATVIEKTVAPTLPNTVLAIYSDKTNETLPVVWNTIEPAKYAQAGTFTVEGTVSGTAVKATANITVEAAVISSLRGASATTKVGTAPVLPEKVTAVYNNGSTGEVAVVWNAVAAERYSKMRTFTVEGTVAGTAEKAKVLVTVNTGLPVLSINLAGNVDPGTIEKDPYIGATYSLTGSGYDDILNAALEIKGRGNSTWDFEKKPYALKLGKKTSLLGMGAAKKWVLLANYVDKTLIRNFATLNLAQSMGMYGTTECKYVDLYLNGEYYGSYLLTEKVEINEERVNIGNDGGVLFEIEQEYRHSGQCSNSAETGMYCYQTPEGVHINFKEPEYADVTPAEYSAILASNTTFFNNMETAMKQGYASYSEYIDVDSFVDWYILNEFCKNYDSSFVTSVYCYRTSAGKLFMGPAWDYDTPYGNQGAGTDGYGNPEGEWVVRAPWYRILLQDEAFASMVADRWTELVEDGTFDNFFEGMYDTRDQIQISAEQNFIRWPNAMSWDGWRDNPDKTYYTYNEEFEYLLDFASLRFSWMNEKWNNDTESEGSLRAELVARISGLPETITEENRAAVLAAIDIYNQLDETVAANLSELITGRYMNARAVLKMDEIASINPTAVETDIRKAPVLPDKVTVVYGDGREAQVTVRWAAIAAGKYAKAGQFTVEGTVDGTSIKAEAVIEVIAEKGDVNGDGEIDIADINMVRNVLTGQEKREEYVLRAYVNDDNELDIADMRAVVNIIMAKG